MKFSKFFGTPFPVISAIIFCIVTSGAMFPAIVEAEPEVNRELVNQDALIAGKILGWSLEGRTQTPLSGSVSFSTPRARPLVDPFIQLGGFKLIYLFIDQYEKSTVNENRRLVQGILLHHDSLRRSISTRFRVDYRVNANNHITIDGAETEPAIVPRPAVSVYFVPARRVTPEVLDYRPVSKLMKYVIKNSAPGNQHRTGSGKQQKYYVFAFLMDRLPSRLKIALIESRLQGATPDREMDTIAFQDNGWHAVCAPSTFAINGNTETQFKVFVAPENGNSEMIALFSSDTLVKRTQRILKAKGYEPGPIDGMMGRKTRKSIRMFQKDCGLKVDGQLTPSLYCTLAAYKGGRQLRPQIVRTTGSPNIFNRINTKAWQNIVEP